MMKKLVALLMALALLCTSIGAFATETTSEPAAETSSEPAAETSSEPAAETSSEPAAETSAPASQEPGVDEPNHAEEDVPYTGNDGKYTKPMATPDNKVHKNGYYDPDQTVDSTCSKEGKYVLRCADCGRVYDYPIAKKDHTWDKDGVSSKNTVKRTCTTDGEITYTGYCTVCQQTITWTEVLKAEGHTYGEQDGELIKEATCTTEEVRRFTCQAVGCGYYEDRKMEDTALGHTWQDSNWTEKHEHVIEKATCAKDGSVGMALVCDRCGEVKPDSIDTVHVVESIDHADEWAARVEVETDEDGNIVYTDELKALLEKLGYANYYEFVAHVTAKKLMDVRVAVYPTITYDLPGDAEDINLVTSDEIPAYDTVFGNYNDADVMGTVEKTKVEYTPATCTTKGKLVLTCTECDAESYTIDLPAHGHYYVRVRDEQEGNLVTDCTKPNSILFQCIYCGHQYNQAFEPADAHVINDEDCMIVAFRQQKEWDAEPITYTVRYSGGRGNYNSYTKAVAEAFKNIATCRDYEVIYKCAVDFCEYTEAIKMAGDPDKHKTDGYIIDIDPTCSSKGYKYYNCKKCGEYVTKEIEELPHTEKYVTVSEPTCTVEGVRKVVCSVCGEELRTEQIPALGHHYIYTTYAANCKLNIMGYEEAVCSKCGDHFINRTWTGHAMPDDGSYIAKTEAKCTIDGEITYVCKYCHQDVTEPILAQGHSYDAEGYKHTECNSECKPATCKVGAAHGNIHVDICTKCGEKKITNDGQIPEHEKFAYDKENNRKILNHFVIVTMPTCTSEGAAKFQCAKDDCGAIIDMVLPKLPHNYEIVFNTENGAYELKCVALKQSNAEKLINKMIKDADYDEMVAEAIVDQLLRGAGENFKGIGCGDVQPIEIRKTEYSVAQISATQGQVVLAEGALPIKGDVWVRIMWKYAFPSGETFTAIDCRAVNMTDATVGTFRLANGQVGNAELQSIFVEVVSDANAADMQKGTYTRYGYQLF